MPRRVLMLILIMLIAGLLTACGSDETPDLQSGGAVRPTQTAPRSATATSAMPDANSVPTTYTLAAQIGNGEVYDIALNGDGLFAVGATGVWRIDTTQPQLPPLHLADYTSFIIFSPDGRVGASLGDDSGLVLWDISTGEALMTLVVEDATIPQVTFNPAGDQLAAITRDIDSNDTLRVWDVATGEVVQEFTVPDESIFGITYRQDGRLIALAGPSTAPQLWDVVAGETYLDLELDPGDEVLGVDFTPDGEQFSILASGIVETYGFRVVRYLPWQQTTTGERSPTLDLNRSSNQNIAFSPDMAAYAVSSSGNGVEIIDVQTDRMLATLGAERYGRLGIHVVRLMRLDAGGSQLAVLDTTGRIDLWNLETERIVAEITHFDSHVTGLAFQGRLLAIGYQSGRLALVDANTGRAFNTVDTSGALSGLAYSPTGEMLATGGGRLALWNTGDYSQESTMGGFDQVDYVAFSPDGRLMILAGTIFGPTDTRTVVRIWDIEADAPALQDFRAHSTTLYALTVSPDGRYVATSGHDNWVRVWNTRTGTQVAELTGPAPGIAFTPDGAQLATINGAAILLWDVATGDMIQEITSDEAEILLSIAFSPDGSLMAVGGLFEAGKVGLWDVAAGEWRAFLEADIGTAQILAFSPDGLWLAAGGSDAIVAVWVGE